MESSNPGLMAGWPDDSLREYLKHQNSTNVDQQAPQKQGLILASGTGGPANYMTLPGTSPKPFEVFFQFDEDEPFKITETRGKFTMEISAYDPPIVEVGGQLTYTPDNSITFTGNGGEKKFKIFLKRKS